MIPLLWSSSWRIILFGYSLPTIRPVTSRDIPSAQNPVKLVASIRIAMPTGGKAEKPVEFVPGSPWGASITAFEHVANKLRTAPYVPIIQLIMGHSQKCLQLLHSSSSGKCQPGGHAFTASYIIQPAIYAAVLPPDEQGICWNRLGCVSERFSANHS